MERYERFRDTIPEEIQTRLITWVKSNSSWKRVFPRYGKPYGVKSSEELRLFTHWLIEELQKPLPEEELPEQYEDEYDEAENDLLLSRSYYYDKSRDVYIVHLQSKKRPLLLQGDFWRGIREAYSNWDNSAESVNEICRNYHLSRSTVVELLRAMGVTHSSSPWTDEVLSDATEDELVEDLLRRKEEQVYVRAQQLEYRKIKRDAYRYRNIEVFARTFREYFKNAGQDVVVPPMKKFRDSASRTPYSLVISPTDFHWGKYGAEYGGDPYNRKIAKERLFKCTQEVMENVSIRGMPEVIYLAIGGDGLHIDNQSSTTTRGTQQDCDGTPTEIAHTYIKLLVEYINFIRQYAKVHVFCIAGNHDYYTTTLIRCAMLGWFSGDEEVSIEDNLSPRQSVLYGKSLITFVHGDDGPLSKYGNIIASENAKLWGKSKYRFIFTGHLHTERELPNFGDVTIYRMPSLAGTDDYHFRKGYKSRKALIGYIVDKEKGVIATEISPV